MKALTLSRSNGTFSDKASGQESVAVHLSKVVRLPKLIGYAAILLFFGGFGTWATVATLASAAIAPGLVSPEGNRKTVQHLEGGIVREILVREGDQVAVGQALLRLDTTQAEAARELYRWQLIAAQAQKSRLLAERNGLQEIAFPPAMGQSDVEQARTREIEDGQRMLFSTRRQALKSRIDILGERLAQYEARIKGYKAQEEAAHRRLALLNDEIGDLETLVERKVSPRSVLLTLQRQAAEVEGLLGNYQAQIANTQEAIGETELEIVEAKNSYLNEVAEELRRVRVEVSDLNERLRSATDILARQEVVAPVSGEVVDLRHFTAGGVIAPGEAILGIVPADAGLVIDAYVNPTDMDTVHAGQKARVLFPAYGQRNMPQIFGKLRSISADRMIEEHSGAPYFLAKVEVDPDELERIAPDIKLSPGMPADVMILTGERTLLDYLTRPFIKSFTKSFRES